MKTLSAPKIAIDLAIAKIDPMAKGLIFGVIENIVSGYIIENNQKVGCIFLTGDGWNRKIKIKQMPIFQYADHYDPTNNWNQMHNLIKTFKVGFKFDNLKNLWISSVIGVESDNPMDAILRDIVLQNYGEELTFEEEFLRAFEIKY